MATLGSGERRQTGLLFPHVGSAVAHTLLHLLRDPALHRCHFTEEECAYNHGPQYVLTGDIFVSANSDTFVA